MNAKLILSCIIFLLCSIIGCHRGDDGNYSHSIPEPLLNFLRANVSESLSEDIEMRLIYMGSISVSNVDIEIYSSALNFKDLVVGRDIVTSQYSLSDRPKKMLTFRIPEYLWSFLEEIQMVDEIIIDQGTL